MKIELTGYELEEAIRQYLYKVFKKNIFEVSVREHEYVTCYVTLGSDVETADSVDEDEPEVIEVKPKRTRRKVEKSEPEKQEVQVTEPLSDEPEDEEDKSTHYANLPTLNVKDNETYIKLLSLLNNNPRNKNRVEIEELVANASTDLMQVILANQSYQDWLAMCVELDADATAKSVIESTESSTTEEESLEERNLRLMKEINDESNGEDEKPSETVAEKPPLFANTQPKGKPLFSFQSGVNKAGSAFPAHTKVEGN